MHHQKIKEGKVFQPFKEEVDMGKLKRDGKWERKEKERGEGEGEWRGTGEGRDGRT